jgi:predicted RecA/RadA family phage recombinase
MPEATFVRDWNKARITLEASAGAGEVRQLPNGLAAFYESSTGASSGDQPTFTSSGLVTIPKTNGIQFLKGGQVFWDHSANAGHYKAVNDRDFYLGTCDGDYASGDTFMNVYLNQYPNYLVDIARDAFISSLTGTVAVTGCNIFRRGGAHNLILNNTSEIQKLDMLSVNGFAPGGNWIVEGAFRIPSDGAGTNTDFNMGIASATHATDADSIAEHLFVHLDGNSTNINIQSKDGTTTVAATDTTSDYTESTTLANRVEFWLDGRDTADIQCYLNGLITLGASTFRLDNAVGPLFLLAHMEKASSADTYEGALDWLRVRLAEQ